MNKILTIGLLVCTLAVLGQDMSKIHKQVDSLATVNLVGTQQNSGAIRCFASIEESESPLIILNGQPASHVSLDSIDSRKVKQVRFVKSSDEISAIYGLMASKGVIFIATKRKYKFRN